MASISRGPTPTVQAVHPDPHTASTSNTTHLGSSNTSLGPSTPSATALKDGKQAISPNFSMPILTGAGATADEQRAKEQAARPPSSTTSPNPAVHAARSLMAGSDRPISRPGDGQSSPPAVNGTDHEIPVTDEPMQIDQQSKPTNGHVDQDAVTDPRLTAPEGNTAPLLSVPQDPQEEQKRSNKAFSYPPRADQLEGADLPGRSMTLPNSSSKSPGSKKHRCHHCGTEFTRHHNLKSHLLTHSQEKPFECGRCEQKFRRLHDLKRHAKLHTGEKPHTCNKCGRPFARGDALARHSKGPGGCAGRRGSGAEDDLDGEDGMEGIEYDENNSEHVAKRRKSEQHLHSRKRSLNATSEGTGARQISMTYPGPGIAPMGNHQQQQQQPPPPSITSHLSPRMTTSQFPSQVSAAQSVFSQTGMTESPKPLSPGQEQSRRLSAGLAITGRGRSPSLQQQHLSRSSLVNSPASGSLPAPGGSQTTLPSLGSIASDRGTSSIGSPTGGNSNPRPGRLPPTISTAHAFNAPPGPGSANSTAPPSATSQHRSSGGSLREIVNPMGSDDYMLKTEHETQMRKMQDEMAKMNAAQQQIMSRLRQLESENAQLRTSRSYPPPLSRADGAAASGQP